MATNRSDAERARDAAVRLLTVRARCRAEVGKALARKEFSPEVIEEALNWLVERQWLDDAAFARAYVRTRAQGQGRARLLADLKRKGVAAHVAEAAIDEELGPEDALAAARDLVARRLRSMSRLDHNTAYRRLAGFLMRRGYNSDVVRRVLQTALPGRNYGEE